MPIETTPKLTAVEQAAVTAEAATRNFTGTPEEFITFYKWGGKDLEESVAKFTDAGTQGFVELGRALFVAVNTEPEKAEQLVPLIGQAKQILGLAD